MPKRKGFKLIEEARPEESRTQCDLLIVDDEVNFPYYIGEMVRRRIPEMKVQFAKDGAEAFIKVYTLRPRILWTNVKMPCIDGLELLGLIKRIPHLKEMKIIVCTAYGNEVVRNRALDLGADVFLRKPFNAEEVFSAIATCLLKV